LLEIFLPCNGSMLNGIFSYPLCFRYYIEFDWNLEVFLLLYILDAVIYLGLNIFILLCSSEIHTSVSEEKAKDKQIQKAETVVGAQGPSSPREFDGENKKLLEQVSKEVEVAMVAPVSSPRTSSPVEGKDDRNLTTLTENQGRYCVYIYNTSSCVS